MREKLKKVGGAESRCTKRCLFNLQRIEGQGFFLFLPKGSEKRRGGTGVPFTPPARGGFSPTPPEGGKGVYVSSVIMLAWPARPYTAPGLLWWVRKLGSLRAGPAREKMKRQERAPGHGRVSSTERLAGRGSGHCLMTKGR